MATSKASSLVLKTDDTLRCHICTDMLRNPKTLDCSHSFCKDCLRVHVQKLQQGDIQYGVACPQETCKKRTPLTSTPGQPGSWVESLPTNIELVALVEAAQGQEDVDDTLKETQICAPCHKLSTVTKASLFCINCNEPQCSQCSLSHSRFTFATDHKVIDVEKMKGTSKSVPENLDRCEVHDKRLKFYCKSHTQMACSLCIIKDHRQCEEIKNIADIANGPETDAKFLPIKRKIEALKQKMKATTNILESNRKDLKCQFDSLPMDIKSAEEKIAMKFVEIKKQVSSQEALNECLDENNAGNEKCMQLQNKLEKTLNEFETCVINGSQVQKFIAVEKLCKQYNGLSRETDDCVKSLNTLSVSLELSDDTKQFLVAKTLGKVAISRNGISIKSMSGHNLNLKKSIVLPKWFKEKGALINGLAFLPDGRLIASDNMNSKMILFDGDLKILAKHMVPKQPQDIATINRDEVIVSCGNELIRYRVTNSNQIKRLAFVAGRNSHFSVSMVNEGCYLVGLYHANKPASLIGDDGVESQLDINFKRRNYRIDGTRCCYSPTSDSVILTEGPTNTVYIYGMSDKSEIEIRDPRIVEPMGVAVSNQGCIFVCNAGNDTIGQISPSGSVISCTQCEGMSNPWSICVHPDGSLLAVANNCIGNKQLQIYSIN